MIYTVTFNPSLDYIVRVEDFKTGEVNRTYYEQILGGGKGVNVSIVLGNMGHESTTLGFTGGFTGDALKQLLWKQGVKTDFIEVKEGFTRINVKLKSAQETEINGQGPKITQENIDTLYAKLDALQDGDVLVISGSIPSSLPDDMYERIMKRLQNKKIEVIVDAEKDLLVNVLKYHPYLIKPNNHELSEIFGTDLQTREEVIPFAKKLQQMGARNVLISMAGKGAVFVSEAGLVMTSEAPHGKVINSVGAGDSMVAGFLCGMMETGDEKQAFLMGICTGSASAFSEQLAERVQVEALMKQLTEKEA
ncbi:MAG: 1-phosphofructokinase [Solobacterium sp.]|jgi:1-phosphofructokinase|nr:1-phosphofructokinase [Solobacterium sp.]MCH4205108.1 1-phosphofructokinase [Solobacterium sp.]MCH4226701.1 1-phosphofructokinase [Solobacterium sp.]MCH4281970.1 1-phosphofructokinase [Solobacterium sp.]